MSNIVPHSTSVFNAVTLCLRRDGVISHLPQTDWQTSADRACDHLTKVGEFLRGDRPDGVFPSPLELRIVGAEPFANVGALREILLCAQANKMIGHVWTTGRWATDEASTQAVLDRLTGLIHAVTLHTGAPAIDEIGIAPLERLIRVLRGNKLGTVIECAVGPNSRLPLELFALDIVNSTSSFIRIVPAAPDADAGTGPQQGDDDFFLPAPQQFDRCAERFSFTVLPNGDVYPCLKGIGFEAMMLGSLSRQSMTEIVDTAQQNTALARLRNEGPAHLFELARAAAPGIDDLRFADSCQLHTGLLARLKQYEME